MIAKRSLLRLLAASALVALQACGGGGKDEATPADTTPPTISSTSVADGASDVLRGTTFVITFSEPIAAASVTASTVTWTQGTGSTPVTFGVVVSGAVVTLTPTAALANFADQVVTVTTGVTDTSGNHFGPAAVYGFKTEDDVAPAFAAAPGDPGATTTSTTVQFTWGTASDDGQGLAAAPYWLEVRTAPGGGTELFNASVGTNLSADVPVADGQTAYARVGATDLAGNQGWSAWSNGITVDATPPGAPGAPTSTTSGWANGTVPYTWTAASDAGSGVASYRIELRTDTSGATGFVAADVGPDLAASFSAAGLATGQTMYTRVQATDAAGNTSAWSGWSAGIGVDLTAPVAPGAPSTAAAVQQSATVHYTWSATTDAGSGVASYWLEARTAPGGGTELFNASVGTNLAQDVVASAGQTVYARVRALDAVGQEAWSGWSGGTLIDQTPPSTPGTPADAGAYSTSTTVHFTLTGSTDAGSGIAGYWLEASSTSGGAPTLFNGPADIVAGVDVTAAQGQSVFARVRAIDGVGNEAWSDWSDGITVDGVAPAVPDAPVATAAWVEDSVTFNLSGGADAVSGRASYTVQLSTVAGDDGAGRLATTAGTSQGFDTTWASDGQALYARALATDVAGNASGWSGWSSVATVDRVGPAFASGVTHAGDWTARMLTIDFGTATDAGSGMVGPYTVHLSSLGEWDPMYEYGTFTVVGPPATIDVTTVGTGIGDAQQIYARVSAVDALGNEGSTGWSNRVTADLSGPETPTPPGFPLAYSNTASLTVFWEFAYDMWSGTAEYRIQASTIDGDSGIFFDQTFSPPVWSATVPAAHGDTVYYRAQAIDAVGNLSAWSSWSGPVLVDLEAPVLTEAPTPNVTRTNGPVTWTWPAATDPVSGTTDYEVQLSATANPDGSGVYATLGATSPYGMSLASRPDGSQVYARVRAYDRAGNVSDWTAFSVAVEIDKSGPVFADVPGDAGDFSQPYVAFTWGLPDDPAGVDAAAYVLEFSTSQSVPGIFDAIAGAVSGDGRDLSALADGTTIYGRVRASDLLGNWAYSDWSNGVSIDRLPPLPPAAPSDPGAVQRGASVLFTWAPAEDDTTITANVSGVREYDVEVRDEGGAIVETATVTGTSFTFVGTVEPMPPYKTYSAQILARDWAGNDSLWSGWSDGITLDPSAPGTPGAPWDEGAYSSTDVLGVHWGVATGTFTAYEVELASGDGRTVLPGACVPPGLGLSTTCDVTGTPNGTTWYARVRAVDGTPDPDVAGGWSDWTNGIMVDRTPPSAPGTPSDRGDFDDVSVRFDWTAATDAESDVMGYAWEVYDYVAAGDVYTLVGGSYGPATFATFDASGHVGRTLKARVQARNHAGTFGDWSGYSDGVVVETGRPWVVDRSPGAGWTDVGTNQDLVFRFSEPMDAASVEAALTLSCGAGCPRNGLAFFWSADLMTLTVMPDTADPVGATNVDLLPEKTAVHVVLTTAATDLAGNALQFDPQNDFTFTTGDETAPQLASLQVLKDGTPYTSPVPAAAVQGGFSVVATFDEPMSPTRGGIRLTTPQGEIEARYSDSWAGVQSVATNTPAPGQATYRLFGCPDIRVGDVVTVQWSNPADFDVTRATVIATGSVGMDCTFTVPNPTSATYLGNAQVSYPYHWSDATIAWTSATTLTLTLPSWISLAPGSDAGVEVNNVSDVGGMWSWGQGTIQVRPLPGTDTVNPTVVSLLPLPASTGVSRTLPVILRFSEPMDEVSLAGAWVTDQAGTAWELRYSSDEMGPVLMAMPPAAAAGGSTVSVHVPGSATDLAGLPLGANLDFTFDVAVQDDFEPPVLFESLPPDNLPVADVWQAQVLFADNGTGMLERLDSASVGSEDVRVTDAGTGLIVRGFRASARAGEGLLEIQPPPRSSGFGPTWGGQSIASATAAGGVATFTTIGDHGLQPGWHVEIQVQGVDNGCFNTAAVLVDVLAPDVFTLPTGCPDASVGNGGWANWQAPRTLVVELGLPPADGGTGIEDFEGNALAPTGFTALMMPAGTNRYPVVEWLSDVRIGVSTAPPGRQLSAYFRVRDADNDDVDVQIVAIGAAGPVWLTGGVPQTLTNTQYGAEYRWGNDGPPTGPSPTEMDVPNFTTSGYYPFVVVLDDGNGGVTPYARYVWVWEPADVPQIDAIDDGGTVKPVDAARPIVVEYSPTPDLRWSHVDVTNADFQGIQYLELSASNVGGQGGGPSALILDKSLTSAPFPTPLEVSFYAWFATQLKFSPGGTNMETQGWSLDFANFLESTFVYGPANRSMGGTTGLGREFGAARASLAYDTSTGGFASASVAGGTYLFESRGTTESAPVFVTKALTDNAGAPWGGPEFFAAALDPSGTGGPFAITTTSPAMMNLPLANRGFVGRDAGDGKGARLFAAATQDPTGIAIEAGAWRDPDIVFGPDLAGTTLGFVQFQVRTDGVTGALQWTEATVGYAAADATDLAVTGWGHDGSPVALSVPYTLAPDGLLTLTGTASGYLGGSPGKLLGALAQTADPTGTFTLLVAQKYEGWIGTEGPEFLDGTYRFVEYTHGMNETCRDLPTPPASLGETHASSGTLTFDGAGGFAYVTLNSGGTMYGTGTYTVDPDAGTVTAIANAGTPEAVTLLFVVGPDGDTLLGASADPARPCTPQVLVVSR
jgi:hypothetical protein